ncbi:MAG: hypothetical protein ACI9JN_000147 [Bacteroidia bacterium]|jgi:hypothetical protein
MIRITFLLLFVSQLTSVFAQDTIRFMHYNLLNYRNTTNQCTNSTNNPETKEGHLQTIVSHIKPDILTVNEMGAHWLNPNKLLTNALNKNGVTHYDQAEYANNSFSGLTNMLFFNSDKLEILSQVALYKDTSGQDMVRVIDVYTLFVKNGALKTGDTTFLTVFVAHLKAGSGSDDKAKRAQMAEATMTYLKNNHFSHSYFFAGDFNIQTNTEACYQTITKHSATTIRFYDPKDAPGRWNNASLYSNLHTQSTHDGDSRGGCFSLGGMDDRFDFILCGKEVLDGKYGVSFISGTYASFGQDSRRFNGNIKNPSSNIIPAAVSNALYEMSDHLPVVMNVAVKDNTVNVDEIESNKAQLVVNYVGDETIQIFLPASFQFEAVYLIDNMGKTVATMGQNQSKQWTITTSSLSKGIYYIKAMTTNGTALMHKVSL